MVSDRFLAPDLDQLQPEDAVFRLGVRWDPDCAGDSGVLVWTAMTRFRVVPACNEPSVSNPAGPGQVRRG
jgi:hypothetical protein